MRLNRTALVVPAGYGDSSHGMDEWEVPLRDFRRPDLDVWALVGFGIVSEARLISYPELLHHDPKDTAVQRESRLRIGAWSMMYAGLYQRVVLVSRGPLMAAWSDAIGGTAMADMTDVLLLRRGKTSLDRQEFVNRLSRLLEPYRRAKPGPDEAVSP